MKSLAFFLGFCLVPAAVAADDVTLTRLLLETSGTEAYQTEVFRDGAKIVARTLECGRKQLTPQEQLTSEFALTGADAVEAQAIFSRQAILASDESIRSPFAATGIWRSLVVEYRFRLPNGTEKDGSQWIRHPLVIHREKTTTLLRRIEARARQVTASVCRD
jgi:hypothetical protein